MAARRDDSVVLIDGPWSHRHINANGSRFHVAELGEGPLVLFLHGFPDFWWTWRHQLVAFANAGYRAVAMDLRGYGASDKPPRGYDAYNLAGDVTGLIRALGEHKAAVIGHDWGGSLAWTVAAFHPQLVNSIGILGSAHPLRLRRALFADRAQRAALKHLFSFQLPRYEHVITKDNAQYVERLITMWASPQWRASEDFAAHVAACRDAMRITQAAFCALEYYRWTVRSLTRRSGWRYASLMDTPITAPVIQLHGALDSCILPTTAHGSDTYVNAPYRFEYMPNVGHFPHLEQANHSNSLLLDWVGRHAH